MRFGTLLTWFYDKDEIDRSPIEIRPLAMSMLVFICYGCLMTVAARISGWSLKSSVDGHVSSIMLEPFSINLFVIFSIISMIFLLIGIVKYKTNDDLRGSKFTKILLAPTINAALSAGSIMIGMLLGMSLGFVMAGAFVSVVNFFCAILSFHHHAGDSMDWSSACIVFKLGFFTFCGMSAILIAFLASFANEKSALNNGLLVITLVGLCFEISMLWIYKRGDFYHILSLIVVIIAACLWAKIRIRRREVKGHLENLAP